jgi:hypothetical protein
MYCVAALPGGAGIQPACGSAAALTIRAVVRSRAASPCPNLASALSARTVDLAALDREDRLVLERARQSVARWLGLVDRLPPAEVLELALDETAYAFETRGPRVRQARENLKKIRAMIRRVQNRGYATMSRLAEHLERLTAGDESNAVIDAGDSVSLMTIHAAKGLEFPVVFVVNLSRGTGGRRHAIRVVSDAENGAAWLSVGDFQSEADADAKAKDREETKRLLYVALTRARDRLYLASEVKDARWRRSAAVLGDILPAGIKARFEVAAPRRRPNYRSGPQHPDTCTHSESVRRRDAKRRDPLEGILLRVSAPLRRDPSDLQTTSLRSSIRSSCLELPSRGHSLQRSRGGARIRSIRAAAASPARSCTDCSSDSARRWPATAPNEDIASELARLIRDEESVEAGDIEDVFEHARDAYLGLCAQAELSDALDSGAPLF